MEIAGFVQIGGAGTVRRGRARARKSTWRRTAASECVRCCAGRSSLPDGGFDFNWELMNERISSTRDQEVQREKDTEQNWRNGRATQEIVADLKDDYVRRIKTWGPQLLCGSHQGNLHLFDMRSKKKLWTSAAHRFEVTSVDYNGRWICSGAVDGSVSLLDSQGKRRLLHAETVDPRHDGIVTRAMLSARQGLFYTASVDGAYRVWDLQSGKLLKENRVPSGILSGAIAGNYVLFGCKSGRVEVYTIDRGLHILSLKCFPSNVTCLQYDKESDKLAVGSASGHVKMLALETGSEVFSFHGHSGPVMSLQYDEQKLVTGGRDGTVRVWDSSDGKNLFSLGGYTAYLTTLQFDRHQLICDGTNNVVAAHKFWSPSAESKAADK